MLCTLRCCLLLLLFVCLCNNGFYPDKSGTFIVLAVGVYVSLWKVCDESDIVLNSNEAAVCKIKVLKAVDTHPSASLLSPIVLCHLRLWVYHPVMAHCGLFLKLPDLLAYSLGFFFLLVFVWRVFSDWCCDNYKGCAAGVPVSRKSHTEPLFSLDD